MPEKQSTLNRIYEKRKNLLVEKNQCVICNMEFIGRNKIVDHYMDHGAQKEEENQKWAENHEEKDGLLRCARCLIEFTELEEFAEHEKDFHQKKPLMCGLCCRCFASKQFFMIHMNSHKETYEPLKCPHCEFTTTIWFAYNSHLSSHPKPDNPFECKDCGAYFILRKDLNEHRRKEHQTVIKSRIYQCTICLRQDDVKSRLRQHIRFHTGERKAICDICGISTDRENLKHHKRVHLGIKPHACTYCEKRFTKKDTLVQHLRVHTGERPHACEYCGKCFTQRTPLVIHLRSHTGERPYVCNICKQGFVSKSALNAHMKSH